MNSDSDSRLSHSSFTNDHRFSTSSPAPSMPSGGGGGLMGASSGSSGASSSAAEEEDTDGEESAPVEEEEEEAVEEQLVSLISAQFIEPETGRIDQDISVEATFEYLTDRTPPLSFLLTATYNDVEETGPVVTAEISEGTASAVVNLAQHMEFYHDEGKTEESKVKYSFKVQCEDDGEELQGDVIELPGLGVNIDLIEIIDSVFNENSPIPLIDSEGMILSSLSACFKHIEEWPDKEITVFGHADPAESHASKFDLSTQRANSIKALLTQDTELWNSITQEEDFIEEYQTILKNLFETRSWNCDPGEVDGASGANTENGLKGFQEQYNTTYEGSLSVDGIIGPNSWEAFMIVIRNLAIEQSELENEPSPIPMFAEHEGIYPCGESCPTADTQIDGYLSESSRRVELLFHDRPAPPTLEAPADGMLIEDILVYDPMVSAVTVVPLSAHTPKKLFEFSF